MMTTESYSPLFTVIHRYSPIPFFIPEREAAQAIPATGHEPVEETGRG
jgi:hypothetical protein